jgi:hypothetical protein
VPIVTAALIISAAVLACYLKKQSLLKEAMQEIEVGVSRPGTGEYSKAVEFSGFDETNITEINSNSGSKFSQVSPQ